MTTLTTNHIIHGDATHALAGLPAQCIDLIITDPPYLVNYRDRAGRKIANDDNPDAVLDAFPEMFRVLKDNSYCLLFCGWVEIAKFSAAWEQAGFRTIGHIVWLKIMKGDRKAIFTAASAANRAAEYLLSRGGGLCS
jgi:DNA modification methylase